MYLVFLSAVSLYPIIGWAPQWLEGDPSGRIAGLGWLWTVMFHHLIHLLSQFCQSTISQSWAKIKVAPAQLSDQMVLLNFRLVWNCKGKISYVVVNGSLVSRPWGETRRSARIRSTTVRRCWSWQRSIHYPAHAVENREFTKLLLNGTQQPFTKRIYS